MFPFAHIDGAIAADPSVYARMAKVQRDESRTQGLGRRELIRFLQFAQAITLLHGALAFLLGIKALRASEAAACGSMTTRVDVPRRIHEQLWRDCPSDRSLRRTRDVTQRGRSMLRRLHEPCG